VIADSETGRFITEQQVGVVTLPEDPVELARTILQLSHTDLRPMGERGQKTVEAQFDRRIALPAFVDCLKVLLS